MPGLFALPPPDPAFEMIIASHGTAQGLRQTEGIQIFPRAYLRFGDVSVGGQWRNIASPTAGGVAALFVRFNRKFPSGQFDGAILYRIKTGVRDREDSTAWEFNASARRSFGRLGLRINAEYSPKEFEGGKSVYVDFSPSVEIDKSTRLSFGIGRRERDGAPDYTSWNLGISRQIDRRFTIDARYFDTNRSELGKPFRPRLVISTRLEL